MVPWVIVVVLLLLGLFFRSWATALRRQVPARGRAAAVLTVVAVAVVVVAIGYGGLQGSLWMAGLGVVGLVLVVLPRRGPVSADRVAAEISSDIQAGRLYLLHLAVNMNGSLLVFRAGARRMPTRAFRLADHCPHCFIERYLSSLLDEPTAEEAVEHYRSRTGAGQAVEVHLKRTETDQLGGWWVVSHHYPSKATWPVTYPVTCAVHRPSR